jgi:hypothetical protein
MILMTVSLVSPTVLIMPVVLTKLKALGASVWRDTQGMVSTTVLILMNVELSRINVNTAALTPKDHTIAPVVLVLL